VDKTAPVRLNFSRTVPLRVFALTWLFYLQDVVTKESVDKVVDEMHPMGVKVKCPTFSAFSIMFTVVNKTI